MILGTAGHIDHGKTTLIRALTGVDTDRLPEEKRRGITIDLGFAPLELAGVGKIGVVDVPGHEAFVRTMVAGATGVDLALLVVAADAGVMPQTREHIAILELLGVTRAVVALTKVDLVETDWLSLVEDDLSATLLTSNFSDAPIVRVSATTGAGLEALREAIAAAALELPARAADDLFRLPIDRAFTMKGTGTVVTGTVWSGTLQHDQVASLHPSNRSVRIRGLQAHGKAVANVSAGERAAVALTGVELADVHRGMVLVRGKGWLESHVFRADVLLLEGDSAIGPREWVRLHIGTQEVGARIVTRGASLSSGHAIPARVVLDAPVVARAGDRFVLRAASPSRTLGGGIITDPHASRRARPWTSPNTAAPERLALLLAEAGVDGLEVDSLGVRLGIAGAELDPLAAERNAWRVGNRLVDADHRDALRQRAQRELASYHSSHSLEPGAPTQWLRSRLGATDEISSATIECLAAEGEVTSERGVIALSGFTPALSGAEAGLRDSMLAGISGAGSEPPSLEELASELGASIATVTGIARWLAREGTLISVEPSRYYTVVVVQDLRTRLEQGMVEPREYSPSELRDLLGLTRKFLIPFLEYCDREGYTIRGGLGRRLSAPFRPDRVS